MTIKRKCAQRRRHIERKSFRRFDRVQTTKCARQSWTVMCKIMIKKNINELGGSGDISSHPPFLFHTPKLNILNTNEVWLCVCSKMYIFPIQYCWPMAFKQYSSVYYQIVNKCNKTQAQPWLYQPTLSSLSDQIICFAFLNKFIQTY